MAASEASKEAVYLNRLLCELQQEAEEAISLSVDSSSARDIAYNPEHHTRAKHIRRRHFFIRELVEQGELVVPLVKTAENLADFFTKPLPWKQFESMRNTIMNVPDRRPPKAPRAPLRGG